MNLYKNAVGKKAIVTTSVHPLLKIGEEIHITRVEEGGGSTNEPRFLIYCAELADKALNFIYDNHIKVEEEKQLEFEF